MAGEHLFWVVSRASGTAGLLLSSAAVCVGLLFGGGLVNALGLITGTITLTVALKLRGPILSAGRRTQCA